MREVNWFKDGLKFECQGCGKCCKNHSNHEYVYVSNIDIQAIAEFISISKNEFISRYCIDVEGYYSLLPGEEDCPFLSENKCRIYEARPKQCATWPFWSENLKKEKWDGPVKECCPGIGKGRTRDQGEILKIAAIRDAWYLR